MEKEMKYRVVEINGKIYVQKECYVDGDGDFVIEWSTVRWYVFGFKRVFESMQDASEYCVNQLQKVPSFKVLGTFTEWDQ
jgi:hypothetical protein